MPGKTSLVAEAIHPALWRASQLARAAGGCVVSSAYASLDEELPGGGWPRACLVEILPPRPGTVELRLLHAALARLEDGAIVLLQAPHRPHIAGLEAYGVKAAGLLRVECATHNDALWAAEQILQSGSASALLFWQEQIRYQSLRRLHLAAQASNCLFFLIRPLQCGSLPSPAPLRLALQPTALGAEIRLIKRKGVPHAAPLLLTLPFHPCLRHDDSSFPRLPESSESSAIRAGAAVGSAAPAFAAA